ncbi:MAG: hypothetical protein ACUZ8I_17270 [Candidatus Scalindua sp.]
MKYRYKNNINIRNTSMTVVCSDGIIEFSTGIMKRSGEFDTLKGYLTQTDDHLASNYKLMEFRLMVRQKYTDLFAEIGAPPDKAELKEAVTGKQTKGKKRMTLLDVLLSYKNKCKTEQIISNGKPLRESTKKNKIATINRFIRVLSRKNLGMFISTRFHRQQSGRVFYETLGNDIISELLAAGYDSSTIHTFINRLKSILRWYLKGEHPDNLDYVKQIKFQKTNYEVEVLNSEDVEYILSHEKELRLMMSLRGRAVMDYLIVSLFLAPRIGDMRLWDSSNLYKKDDGTWLKYYQQKTGVKIDVPINLVVERIFSRNLISYSSCLPKVMGDINLPLRKILSLVPSLQEQGTRSRIIGGVLTEIKKPRWEMISIHKMRATAITNMLDAGVPEHVVKSFSGHTGDSNSFSRYVNAKEETKKKASETYLKSISI